MPTSARSLGYEPRLLSALWTQWAWLGVSGQASNRFSAAIDPEALLLATLEIARADPRLFDEVLDWLCANGRHITLQRLVNLTPGFPIDDQLVDATITWVGENSRSVRWPARSPSRDPGNPVDLFRSGVATFAPAPDPVFLRFGYRRPPVTASGKSSAPDVRAMPNIALRLRLLFGPGARAEVMRILLTTYDSALNAARIADEAAFAKRNVNDALSALAESGAVKARWSRNERVFTAPRSTWSNLLDTSQEALPGVVSWVNVWPALVRIEQWLEGTKHEESSDNLTRSRTVDVLETVRPGLEAAGLHVEQMPRTTNDDFWAAVQRLLEPVVRIAETGAS